MGSMERRIDIKGLTLETCTKALFDQLVEPTLKLKGDVKDPPLEIQDKVAKQMYAVALLYNYFFKQNYFLKEVDWKTFCKRTPLLSRQLLPFLKQFKGGSMQKSPTSNADLSRMERSVKEAYDTTDLLIKLKTQPRMLDGWSVAKIAVFVVDHQCESCILLMGAVTEGCFSLVEKELDSVGDLEDLNPIKFAISDKTGINPANLMLAKESKLVYSLTKPQTQCKLFYAKCIKETLGLKDTAKWVSFSVALECAKKPLIEGQQFDPETDECLVQYFHLESFIPVLEEWISKGAIQFMDENEEMKTSSNKNPDLNDGSSFDPDYDNYMMNSNIPLNVNGQFSVSSRQKHPRDINASEKLEDRVKRPKEPEKHQINSDTRRSFLHGNTNMHGNTHKVNVESNSVKPITKAVPVKHQNGIETGHYSHDVLREIHKRVGELFDGQMKHQREVKNSAEKAKDLYNKVGAILSGDQSAENFGKSMTESPAADKGSKVNHPDVMLNKHRAHTGGIDAFPGPIEELHHRCTLNGWGVLFKTNKGQPSSTVVVEGSDFKYTYQGERKSSIIEAEESAAARMLKEL